MSTPQVPTVDIPYPEAPASWNTRYVTPEGFVCQITLRGENGRDLLEKAGVALSYLLAHGYTPSQDNHRNHNGKDTRSCPIHNIEMHRREKDGKVWYSHKLEDGKWCYGKQPGRRQP